MKPLRVTLVLDTPYVDGPHPPHLDDIIAWAAVQQAQLDGELTDFDAVLHSLPMDRASKDGIWCWKASMLWPQQRWGLTQRYINRRFWEEGYAELFAQRLVSVGKKEETSSVPDVRAAEVLNAPPGTEVLGAGVKAGAIDTQRNHLKNASFLYPVVSCPSVVGFCIGDQARIELLLKTHLKHFGKRSRLGHGRIKHILVEEDPSAELLWDQRALPWPKEGYEPLMSPVSPPYWDRSRAVMAYRPTSFQTYAL